MHPWLHFVQKFVVFFSGPSEKIERAGEAAHSFFLNGKTGSVPSLLYEGAVLKKYAGYYVYK